MFSDHTPEQLADLQTELEASWADHCSKRAELHREGERIQELLSAVREAQLIHEAGVVMIPVEP